jgi:hypothetical protein
MPLIRKMNVFSYAIIEQVVERRLYKSGLHLVLPKFKEKMINPRCNSCAAELDEFGGILLSPPDKDGKCKKFHLCTECYVEIAEDLIDTKAF